MGRAGYASAHGFKFGEVVMFVLLGFFKSKKLHYAIFKHPDGPKGLT